MGSSNSTSSVGHKQDNAEFVASCRSNISDWPPLVERRWQTPELEDYTQGTFRIMSFNLLADGKQGEENWTCSKECLQWEHRKWLLLEEMCTYSPDIMLFQEVDAIHFSMFFEGKLREVGYKGEFKQMPDSRPDGVAVFWKEEHFRHVCSVPIDYKAHGEVALAVRLAYDCTGNGTSSNEFLAVTTHLASGKDAKSEQLRMDQVDELLQALQDQACMVPIVIGTDMNAEPVVSSSSVEPLAVPRLLNHPLNPNLQSAYPIFPSPSLILQSASVIQLGRNARKVRFAVLWIT